MPGKRPGEFVGSGRFDPCRVRIAGRLPVRKPKAGWRLDRRQGGLRHGCDDPAAAGADTRARRAGAARRRRSARSCGRSRYRPIARTNASRARSCGLRLTRRRIAAQPARRPAALGHRRHASGARCAPPGPTLSRMRAATEHSASTPPRRDVSRSRCSTSTRRCHATATGGSAPQPARRRRTTPRRTRTRSTMPRSSPSTRTPESRPQLEPKQRRARVTPPWQTPPRSRSPPASAPGGSARAATAAAAKRPWRRCPPCAHAVPGRST